MTKKYDLEKGNIRKLFAHYAVLSVVGLGAMAINILLDGIFVGYGVGPTGLASVNLVLPLFPVLLALGMLFGAGAGTLIAIEMGKHNSEEGNKIFNNALAWSVGIGVLITLIIQIFSYEIVSALGSTPGLREGVTIYLKTFSIFSVFYIVILFLEPVIRNDKAPKLVMISLVAGSLTNACLNYLFIFVFDWGLFGASLATGLSQVVSFFILFSHFFFKKGEIRIKKVKSDINHMVQVVKIGTPLFMTQICIAIFIIIYNWVIITQIGEGGIAVIGIILYLNEIVMLTNYGFGEALQPIASFNYGAKQYDRMRQVFKIALKASLVFTFIIMILFMLVPQVFISMFTNDSNLIKETIPALRMYYSGLLFSAVNMVVIAYFQAVACPREATLITFLRNIGLFGLMIFVLPKLIGVPGIWLAYAAGDLLTLLITFFILYRRKFYFFSKF